ncbi:hypothetical protein IWW38_000541 [Coemansia aciculifera]|uniref:Uncharacterized protein n=1 Tax=Coemansia aciculifera TaxID=417176 RepID=A0ACC1MAL2_9FUNG|nr:hypothetical protein IWW38_000541 [Coemansia aciculifera]
MSSSLALIVAESGNTDVTLPGSASSSMTSAGSKRSRSDKTTAPPEIITTGAFYTRATLRKLGVAEDPETPGGMLQVGDWVRVLNVDKKWYTGAILSLSASRGALVHYPGWEHKYNEWIALGSRRLLQGGEAEAGFDLEAAIRDAGVGGTPLDAEEEEEEEEEAMVAVAVEAARPRGRPSGSRNRRRVGHIKKRIRKAPPVSKEKESEAPAEVEEEEEEEEALPAQPSYRIAKARPLTNGSLNPYAKQLGPPASAAAESPSTDPANEVWGLVRGPYVTTGAFLTRRTIKCLAHNDATGGIIQDHHGVYPGQTVQVMNANKKWYGARVLSYADKKFLVHFNDWDHSHDEWVAADSKRLRKVAPVGGESEEDARRICAGLVDQYNAYVEGIDRAREEAQRAAALAKRRAPVIRPTVVPANAQPVSRLGKAIQQEEEEEDEEEIDENVEPISVDSGYSAVPQLLRVKDYVQIYRRGMVVAARDRNKVWWRAEIVDIRTFRFRVHYFGFPKVWDEWMEMNTQRVMLADDQPPAAVVVVVAADEDGDSSSSSSEEEEEEKEEKSAAPAPSKDAGKDTVFHLPKERMSTKDYGLFLKAGDLVEIRDRDNLWYGCTIIDVKHGRIRVCFNGHTSEYNQWVAVNSDRIRVLRATVEGDDRLQRLAQTAQAAQRRRREKAAAQRRARHGGPTAAALVRVAERLEHINEEDDDDLDDLPLLYRLSGDKKEADDGLPLATRLVAAEKEDSATWFVYCNQCRVVIRTFRYFCVACERPSEGLDYESFDLCLGCFARGFPRDHAHPPTAFARAAVVDAASIVAFAAEALAGHPQALEAYERDTFAQESAATAVAAVDEGPGGWRRLAAGLHGTAVAAFDGSAVIGRPSAAAVRRCAFCGGDEEAGGAFAGARAFELGGGAVFWAHDACARYSPEVLATAGGGGGGGGWFNVAAALRRARTIKCAACRRRGATVGCFHERCQRSYHVPCTGQTRDQLAQGLTFWCDRHRGDSKEGGREEAGRLPSCACCGRDVSRDLLWMACAECARFSVCLTCYDAPAALANHPHKKRCFREKTHASAAAAVVSPAASASACHYCRRPHATRRGYGGVVMCSTCFGAAHRLDNDVLNPAEEGDFDQAEGGELVALNPLGSSSSAKALGIDDYAHSTYFTRDACTAAAAPLGALSSYGPTDAMLFTLAVDSTYFDIPGRAPRWASHSGADYHGTWLPQTVRRALLRHTRRGDRVLSNFLGRGTDAIESFLLSRKCVGVDINPAAVALAQRNCSFPIARTMAVDFRPVIMHGDARALCEAGWPGAPFFAEPECFDHVLSHPPYKDCVLYSTNIDGDLSRFPGPEDFRREMEKVIATSWRLLRMGRHLTLGIGDNRAECFYVPVSFHLIRSYIDHGFVLEELIVKRQRYCQAFGLGMYLCVQFDFLMFTHEFIATLRKVPKDHVDSMRLSFGECPEESGLVRVAGSVRREVPLSPIERKSVVMGSVWSFDKHHRHSFPQLCMSRMVERFGRDNSTWEHVDLVLLADSPTSEPADPIAHSDDDSGDSDSSSDSEEFNDNGTRAGIYERRRLRQIQQNRAQLLHLGLVSELGEDSSDTAHYLKLLSMPQSTADEHPSLIVVPHIPNAQFQLRHIEPYRRALAQITQDASHRLCPAGMLIIGTQDVRDEAGKLWPLGMLVLEDVQSAVGAIRLRLKEFIVVVEHGHAKRRDDVVSREEFVEEQCVVGCEDQKHVPIVHAYYLVFMKLK